LERLGKIYEKAKDKKWE